MRERLGRALINAAPVWAGAPAAGSEWMVQQCDGWLELGSCGAGGRNGEWNEEGDKKKEEGKRQRERKRKRKKESGEGRRADVRLISRHCDRGLVPIRRLSPFCSARREHHPGVSQRDAVPLHLLGRALGARGGRSGRRAGRRRRPRPRRRTAARWFAHDELGGIFAQIPAPRVHVAVLRQTATIDVANGEGDDATLCGRTQRSSTRRRRSVRTANGEEHLQQDGSARTAARMIECMRATRCVCYVCV